MQRRLDVWPNIAGLQRQRSVNTMTGISDYPESSLSVAV